MSEPQRELDEPVPQVSAVPAAARGRRQVSLWEMWGVIAAGTLFIGGGAEILWPAPSGDKVPPDVAAKRQDLFRAMVPILIVPAGDEEERRLANTMALPEPEKELLLTTIREEMRAQAPVLKAAAAEAVATPAEAKKAARPVSAKPAAAAGRPVTLTQITLWDTDAVDGDVVRIVSAGYEMEVVLAKAPVTLAVPVPPAGVVNIVGVRDGGGGITVGIAVGGRSVELPLMSAGQSLGIPVLVRP